jgi:hypothetical protein
MDMTYKNYFKFGYNNEWFNSRQSSEDIWMASYGACERQASDFKSECYATARLIRDTTTGPLTLLFSGGVDSEVVLRSFHDQGIPINVAICQFNNNLNIFDISYAIVCCNQLNVPYKLVQLDILKFLEQEVFDYCTRVNLSSPELSTSMWLADQVDGIPIGGSGDSPIEKHMNKWYLYEKEYGCCWYRHFFMTGKERMAVPRFFQYTPELLLSFIQDDTFVNMIKENTQKSNVDITGLTIKLSMYQKYFPVSSRMKYGGFEQLGNQLKNIRRELLKKPITSLAIYLTEYNDIIKMLNNKWDGSHKGIIKYFKNTV